MEYVRLGRTGLRVSRIGLGCMSYGNAAAGMHQWTLDEDAAAAGQKIAEARDVPMAQVALAWVLSKPVVSGPIVGATKPRHLQDAVAALDLELTGSEITELEERYTAQDNYWW
jgi:aryl-alcohol dehydrogenase-like predicted oxidoreductase